MELQTNSAWGLAHYLAGADGVARAVLAMLLALSVASWYLILTKACAHYRKQRRASAFLSAFWRTDTPRPWLADLPAGLRDEPFARLAASGLQAAQDAGASRDQVAQAGGFAEYLTRVLNHVIDQEAARIEHGLTVLASAGAAAPYIGLFGTVWGIYHALSQLGAVGQATLDQVAGPVGEALIMTGVGLAVAIPAVLAYNAFSRRNRMWLAGMESFAHDLYVQLTVRAGVAPGAGNARAHA